MNKRSRKKRMKRIVKATGFAFAMAIFSATIYIAQIKEVNVNYLGQNISFRTMASTVSDALKEKNIEIKDDENISTDIYSKLGKSNNIVIDKPIIFAMKEEIVEAPKIVEQIEEVVPIEEVSAQEEKVVIEPEVTREEKKESKPSKTATSRGTERTTWAPDVIEVEEGVLETADGDVIEYSQVMQLEATAYCPCYSCCGKYPGNKWYNITATGTVGKVGTIAVDPRVIPLGTKVYIEGLNGAKNYGYAVAEDTGGAIKGKIIDLYFNTHKETVNWGRQQVNVYILK